MARWMKPSEELPEVDAGERVVIIVKERMGRGRPFSLQLVILEATETGWYSPDPTYAGYSIEDGCLWSPERSVCEIANVIGEACEHGVQEGDYCEPCNRAYKDAARDLEG